MGAKHGHCDPRIPESWECSITGVYGDHAERARKSEFTTLLAAVVQLGTTTL